MIERKIDSDVYFLGNFPIPVLHSKITQDLHQAVGPLSYIKKELDCKTLLHADEIVDTQISNRYLKDGGNAGDFFFYRIEGNNKVLYIAKAEYNLIFQNVKEAGNELAKTGFFELTSRESVEEIIKAETTLRICLNELPWHHKSGLDWFTRIVPIDKYDEQNATGKSLFDRICGAEEEHRDYIQEMALPPGLIIRVPLPGDLTKFAKNNAIATVGSLLTTCYMILDILGMPQRYFTFFGKPNSDGKVVNSGMKKESNLQLTV